MNRNCTGGDAELESGIHRPIPGFRPSTPPITSATIDETLRSHRAVVIHFWAEWNGHDPPMDHCIQEVRSWIGDDIHFVSCNVDLPENADLAKRCNVVSIPCLAVFVAGQQRGAIVGLQSTDDLETELKKRLTDSGTGRKWWRIWLKN